MTERDSMEPFETRFAERVRAYTDAASTRRIDALEVSRAAMASQRTAGWSVGLLGAGAPSRRTFGLGWAAAVAAALLIAVIAVTIERRPTESVGGPIPDLLRHAWGRPVPVLPGNDVYLPGFLNLASGQLEFGRQPGAGASRSAIAATGPDTLAVTATVDTIGCAIGDLGAYGWVVEGKGTVLALTPIGTDACAPREEAVAGAWVRSDLPPPADPAATLSPGTYQTSSFAPFGDPARPGQLTYTVPAGWKVKEDEPGSFVLHRLGDSGQASGDVFLGIIAQPAMAAEFTPGADCASATDASGVGRGRDALVAAIRARPSVVSTAPVAVTVGGYPGLSLDLRLSPTWTGGCVDPGGGTVIGTLLLHEPGSGAGIGLAPDAPVRLILVDLGEDRTMAIALSGIGQTASSSFGDQAAAAMPVIESFQLRRSTP